MKPSHPTIDLEPMRAAAVNTTRRNGKSILYSVASPQALAVMAVLYQQFCGTTTHEEATC